jgi:hypothetical protein
MSNPTKNAVVLIATRPRDGRLAGVPARIASSSPSPGKKRLTPLVARGLHSMTTSEPLAARMMSNDTCPCQSILAAKRFTKSTTSGASTRS